MDSDRRDRRNVGVSALVLGLLVVAVAVAGVVEVWMRPLNCPPTAINCGGARGLVVYLATPFVLGGLLIAGLGALGISAARRKA